MPPFVQGAVLGFSIAVPVGPIGVLCIRRSIAEGALVGFVCGLGAATADAIYGAIGAAGLTIVSDLVVRLQSGLSLLGGLFLCYLGLKTWRSRPADRAARFGLGREGASWPEAVQLVSGVFLGSAAWWLILSVGSRRLGARLGAREMTWLNRLSGGVILGFGFWNLSKLAFQ
jgi:threonine/homoserine/homoserine lactone efflux protein